MKTYFFETAISWWHRAFTFISRLRVNFFARFVVIIFLCALLTKFFTVITKLLLKLWSDVFKKIWLLVKHAKYGRFWWNFISWAFWNAFLISVGALTLIFFRTPFLKSWSDCFWNLVMLQFINWNLINFMLFWAVDPNVNILILFLLGEPKRLNFLYSILIWYFMDNFNLLVLLPFELRGWRFIQLLDNCVFELVEIFAVLFLCFLNAILAIYFRLKILFCWMLTCIHVTVFLCFSFEDQFLEIFSVRLMHSLIFGLARWEYRFNLLIGQLRHNFVVPVQIIIG